MYIIGDVQGSYKTLPSHVEKIPYHEKIVFTGDLIDRGPQCSEL